MKLPRKHQYPKKIKVKDVEYSVVFVDQIEGRDNLGICYGDERKLILLKNKIGLPLTFKTFIHEVLHAIENEYGFEIAHEHIYNFQDGIFQVLVDNIVGSLFQNK